MGIELEWCDKEENEKGIVKSFMNDQLEFMMEQIQKTLATNIKLNLFNISLGDIVVQVASTYYRPTEVDVLIGNSFKVAQQLNWKARTNFQELIKLMVTEDFQNTYGTVLSKNLSSQINK